MIIPCKHNMTVDCEFCFENGADIRTNAERERDEAVHELTEAIRLTVEYIDTTLLPPLEGWSWFDALKKYAPDKAQAFVDQRDKRWENMWAYVGEPLLYNIDLDYPPKGMYIDFEIHVRYDGQQFNARQRMSREDLEHIRIPNIFEWIMEEEIKFIDKFMNHWDKYGVHLDYVD